MSQPEMQSVCEFFLYRCICNTCSCFFEERSHIWMMETTDQNMVENSEDLGPLLMHDPGDEVVSFHQSHWSQIYLVCHHSSKTRCLTCQFFFKVLLLWYDYKGWTACEPRCIEIECIMVVAVMYHIWCNDRY